jgi:hypothetical protein
MMKQMTALPTGKGRRKGMGGLGGLGGLPGFGSGSPFGF